MIIQSYARPRNELIKHGWTSKFWEKSFLNTKYTKVTKGKGRKIGIRFYLVYFVSLRQAQDIAFVFNGFSKN